MSDMQYLVSEILSHTTAPFHKRRGTDVPSVWDEGYHEHDDDTDDDSSDDDDKEPNIWDTAAAGPSGETHTPSPPVTPGKKTTSSTEPAKKTSAKKATKEKTKEKQKSATTATTTSPASQPDHSPFGDPSTRSGRSSVRQTTPNQSPYKNENSLSHKKILILPRRSRSSRQC